MVQIGCCIPGGSFMPQGENDVPLSAKEILQSASQSILSVGFDYAETSAGFLNQLSEEDVCELENENKAGKLLIRACNSFIPPQYPIFDPQKQTELYQYVDKILSICARIGIGIMVFGSGGARTVPEGMSREEGREGIIRFLKNCAVYAEKYGVTIVVEPLNSEETNIITTVSEGAEIVRAVAHPRILLLADAFHVFKENEDLSVLADNADILTHIHVSEPPERVYPGRDGGEYLRRFACALKKTGYSKKISVECGFSDFEKEIQYSNLFMKEVFGMNIKLESRRTVTGEPVVVRTGILTNEVRSVETADGRRFPAQKKGDKLVVVADLNEKEPVEAALSEEPAEGGVDIRFADDHKALDVYIGGKLFTSYVFDRGLVKPYLGPIYNRDGSSYTRLDLTIEEHPHQRSVYFAVGDVNGIDFWNEYDEKRGEERHKGFDEIVSGPAYGSFTANNVWCSHEGEPVVDEKRTFTFYNQPENCRYVDAEVTFTASYGDVHFGNTKEAGPLGIRVNPQLAGDQTGTLCNAYGGVGEEECWGRPAPWCDYNGTIDGKPYGIAVFDNEDNERYPTTWHIRNYGLFAANNLYFKGGYDLKKHFSITYRYRICFHEGKLNTADRFMVYAK